MPDTLTLIEKTVFLSSVEALANVPTEALAQLAERATEVHAEPDEVLFREGDEDQGTFIVVEGLVELRHDDAVVRILRGGSEHGEFLFGSGETHQYTGVAREETHALNIQRDDILDVLPDSPDLALGFLRMQALRVQRLTGALVRMEKRIQRLAGALEAAGIEVPANEDEATPTDGVAGEPGDLGAKPEG